jgi:hypothetical protein
VRSNADEASVAPVPSAPPTSGGGAITVDQLHDLWPKIRLDIKARDRRIEALLSSCDPASVSGTSITLVTSYKFHWERMNEDASRQLVESVIGRLVNQPVSVSTEIRGANGAPNGAATHQREPIGAARSDAPDSEASLPPERSEEEQALIDAARNIFDAEELTRQS